MIYSSDLLRHLRFTISQNIHSLRTRRKMPLLKLAHKVGVPLEKIDHYELGKNEIPLDHALKIACALGVDIGVLMR